MKLKEYSRINNEKFTNRSMYKQLRPGSRGAVSQMDIWLWITFCCIQQREKLVPTGQQDPRHQIVPLFYQLPQSRQMDHQTEFL